MGVSQRTASVHAEHYGAFGIIHQHYYICAHAVRDVYKRQGISIAALLAGRQSMKADVLQKEYREKLFENLSSNIDFAFLLYTPAIGKVELVSENRPGLLGITAQEVREKPELVFDAGGMAKKDTDRNGFLKGMLQEQITRESLVGAGPNQVRRWIEIHLIPADYGQYLAVFHETTGGT